MGLKLNFFHQKFDFLKNQRMEIILFHRSFIVYGQQNHVKKPHENPSIGIVLCKSTNKEFVEYVIQDYQKPMGVATYKTTTDMPEELRHALPNIEELKKL